MRVNLSSHFRAYTGNRPSVEAAGETVGAVLADLDRQFPGLRFRLVDEQDRLRRHLKVFVNTRSVDSLDTPVRPTDEVHVLGALSGG